MPLCEQCSAVTLPALLSPEGQLHHESYASLQTAAVNCDVCNVISLHLQPELIKAVASTAPDALGGILKEFATPITLQYSVGYDIAVARGEPRKINRDPTNRSYLRVRCGRVKANVVDDTSSTSLDVTASVPVFVYEDDPLARLGIQVRSPLAPNSMAPENCSKIKAWMQHCLETHVECQILEAQTKQFPSILLDLQDVKVGGDLRIFDVNSDFNSEYVALSYSWGTVDASWIDYVKTCQHSSRRTVEFNRMPQTLQDAVTCCLKLGHRYIWIDCLSILQGNKDHWLSESSKMSDIYANAVLVISASDSKNCGDGFLSDRTPLQRDGAVLTSLVDENGLTCQLRLALPNTDFQKLVGEGPVAQRGWCLQERQLCSRLLHVCQGEIFFECMRCRRFESESGPGEEFDLNDEFFAYHMPRETHDTSRGKPSPDVKNILSWYSILQDYTRRGLTMPGDKLVAVAGLARRAHRILQGEYLAGLWRNQIQIGLLWMIDEDASASRAPVYRAPSWSWASMDGPVSWSLIDGWVQSDDGFVESAIEVIDAQVQLEASDPFGPVEKVEIIVAGRVKYISASTLLPNKVLTYPAWMSGDSAYVGCYLEDEKRSIDTEKIPCLKIATRPFGPGPSLPPTNEIIVLEKVEKVEDASQHVDTYKRVGFGQVLVTDYFDDCAMTQLRLL